MTKFKIHCNCGEVHEIKKDIDFPIDAFLMGCNWCPVCEDTVEEWYNYEDLEPVISNPNQIKLQLL